MKIAVRMYVFMVVLETKKILVVRAQNYVKWAELSL